jgi:hypothetical protein
MAKRHLDLRGAKAPKLELDILRLVYAVKELRTRGDEALGYLLVLSPEVGSRARSWSVKYAAADAVEVLIGELDDQERLTIANEVRRNTEGMVAGTRGEAVGGASDSTEGAWLAEAKLLAEIRRREPGVTPVSELALYPFGIRWDFYGTRAA